MNENDVIKAMECCVDERKKCRECPYWELPQKCAGFHRDVLNLINQQKAEIEKLNAEVERQYEQAQADILGNMPDGGTSCHWCIEQHKAETVEEFAERIESKLANNINIGLAEYQFVIADINAAAKEMKEAQHDRT